VPVPGLGSTVEITRSLVTRRAIRNIPSEPVSRSWPSTVAITAAACITSSASSRPSSSASTANPSRTRESINSSRAAPVIPVDLRLASRDVAIPARQHRPQLSGQLALGDGE
jgi:hypothetical protein